MSSVKNVGRKKLRVAEVARDLGVHRNAITLLYEETAKRIDINLVDKLCDYFSCTITDLLEYKKIDKLSLVNEKKKTK